MAEWIPPCTPSNGYFYSFAGRGRMQTGIETKRNIFFRLALKWNILDYLHELFTFHFDTMLMLRIRRLLTFTACWVFSDNFTSLSSTCIQKECKFSVSYVKGKTLLGLPHVQYFQETDWAVPLPNPVLSGPDGWQNWLATGHQGSEPKAMVDSLSLGPEVQLNEPTRCENDVLVSPYISLQRKTTICKDKGRKHIKIFWMCSHLYVFMLEDDSCSSLFTSEL